MQALLSNPAPVTTPVTYVFPGLLTPHTHFREGEVMGPAVQFAYRGGARLVGPMPNTDEGLMKAGQVMSYSARGKSFVPIGKTMHFVDIVQITERTTRADIDACIAVGIRDGKVYPKGRTTGSHNGVSDYYKILDIVKYAGRVGMRIHLHPEHPLEMFGIRDGEFGFLAIMDMFMRATAKTKTVFFWEHGTDARCIPFWQEWAKSGRFFLTITAHHLLENDTRSFGDVGTACKPSVKTENDRQGMLYLASSGLWWVMAGADDAPHPDEKKFKIGNCACGAYTAPFLFPLYAHALKHMLTTPWGQDNFKKFTHGNAHRVFLSQGESEPVPMVTLVQKPFVIPLSYQLGPWKVTPFWAGRTIDFETPDELLLAA